MDKLPKTKAEIERLLIAELHAIPDCDEALDVIVVPIDSHIGAATWTVSSFNYGKSDGESCERSLQDIVPRLQRLFDLVSKH